MRILLLNLGSESSQDVKHALSGQGYDIAADRSLTIDEILERSPELLITEATPSDLTCCGLITQIKASSNLPALKIVMIVHGDALERARGGPRHLRPPRWNSIIGVKPVCPAILSF
jgi:DNA-binding response OmpR family regulator